MTDAKTTKSVIKAADMPNVRLDRARERRRRDDADDYVDTIAPSRPAFVDPPSRATRHRARDD